MLRLYSRASTFFKKDTVSTDEEDDEVEADQDARHGRPPMSQYAVIHDSIPVLTSQNLMHIIYTLICFSK